MTGKSVPLLSDHQVTAFRRDGVICLRQVFDQEWIELLRRGAERAVSEPGEYAWTFMDEEDGRRFTNQNRRWHEIDEYRRFIFDSPVAPLAGTLMGWTHVSLLYESVFFRTAAANATSPWHQDMPYYCVDGRDCLCAAWTPLYPVDRDSALECIRGSHRWGKTYFRLNFDSAGAKGQMDASGDDESQWDELPDIEANRGEYDIISYAMEPGDCLIFDGMLLHASPGNRNPKTPLVVVSVRLLGDTAVYWPDKIGGTVPNLEHHAAACNLKPGDPMTSESFPKLWQA